MAVKYEIIQQRSFKWVVLAMFCEKIFGDCLVLDENGLRSR